MDDLEPLDPTTTALVLIDLQQGIIGGETFPHSPKDVIDRAARLAAAFRERGALVVLVHVDPGPNGELFPRPKTDVPRQVRAPSAEWSRIVPQLGPQAGDVTVLKHQPNAFYCTDLDVQLRRRGIRSIVLGGISTNVGVESTARDAFERGYDQLFVEDVMAARDEVLHTHSVTRIFPTMGRVRTSDVVIGALGGQR